MRLSTRLLSNAVSTYLRLGTTFVLGLFTTWYVLGQAGVVGFGLIALATSSAALSTALDRALRFGLVRELAAAAASAEPGTIRRSLASAYRLCRQVAVPVSGFVLLVAALAWFGLFNTPVNQPELEWALALLILGEGIHALARLLAAPYIQLLFAAQQVAVDNLLIVIGRVTYAASAVLIFGWLLPDADLAVQLTGLAATRCTLQLIDLALGIWFAKRSFPGLRLEREAFDEDEYRSIRSTIWHSSQVVVLLNANYMFLAVLINLFFGLTYNGLWQIVVQFAGFARMIGEGLLRGIAPLTTHLQEGGRPRAVVELMTRSVRYQFAIALPTALLLGIWVGPLLTLWVGDRLAGDRHLAAAGFAAGEAVALASVMAVILIIARTLRTGFFGIESVLYGIGKVRSYSWAAKWALLISIGLATAAMAWLGDPLAAPVSALISQTLFSPVVVLLAARREGGLDIGATLWRTLPRPLIGNLVFLALLLPARLAVDRLSLVSLAALLVGAAVAYTLLALLVIATRDERRRLRQLAGQGLAWLRRRDPPAASGP